MGKVGFTTTIPVEILFAAGKRPLDLNNIFITSENAKQWVDEAEEAGYPRNTCGWIKGLYSVALDQQLDALIAVMQGDCSNTQALMETLQIKGVKTIPFAYPFNRRKQVLVSHIQEMMDEFGVGLPRVLGVKRELDEVRRLCREIDELTWKENLVSGFENHYYLVSSSDFNGDYQGFAREMDAFIKKVRQREPFKEKVRLAYIGVPPIFTDLYEVVESLGARIVYNEVQRQFSMPFDTADIYEQYISYTYPYGAFARLKDMQEQTWLRQVDGVIHYTQTFCYRQIEDLIYREGLKIPFLTLEGDKPGRVDARSRMRLEAFIGMIKAAGRR
ncbi:2-hydroxyacyl-CoA dehydratase family protein [Syntrophomonas erecta]